MHSKNKNRIYTRNSEPLQKGDPLINFSLFDQQEAEHSLQDHKGIKVVFSIPTFSNQHYAKELRKLDFVLKNHTKIACYAISNEPVFTQKRLTKSCSFEKIQILSDFKDRNFARYTGTYIYELSQLVKACLIIDDHGKILFTQYIDDLQAPFDSQSIAEILDEIKQNTL